MKRLKVGEKTRTVILVILLIIAVGFIFSFQNSVDSNFVETL